MPPIYAPRARKALNLRVIATIFVLAMAAAFTTIAALLIADTRSTVERHLIATVEQHSEEMATQLGRRIFTMLHDLGGTPDDLRAGEHASRKFDAPMRDAIDRRIRAFVEGTAIVKVKIYARDGITIYSTAAADVGQTKYAPAFDSAVNGQTSTEINTRRQFTGLNGELRDVVLAASYIPIHWGPVPEPSAILETYVDVTADMARIGATIDDRARLLVTGFAILFALIAALTFAAAAVLRHAIDSRDEQTAARAASETLFAEAIESIGDGLLIFTEDQRLLHWNSQLEIIFPHLVGRLRRDMTQRELLELHAASDLYAIPENEREAWVTARLPTLQPGRVTPAKTLADGRVVQGAARRRQSGGFIVTVRDMTAETTARAELAAAIARAEASERRFRDFAEASSDWFWEAGPDGRLTYLSPGIMRFGVTPEQLIGQGRSTLPYQVPRGQAGTALIAAATAAREPFKDVEYEGILRDGRHVYITVTGRPQFAADGTYLGHRGTGRDITEVTVSRQRLEAALAEREAQEKSLAAALNNEREAAQQQRRFIAIVAHEFRTPLTIIDGAAQRLARNAGQIVSTELLERADRIRRAVGRLSQMIDTTLNSARLDAGNIEANLSQIDVVALVTMVVRRHEELSRDFTFSVSSDRTHVNIDGDARLLEQVFSNLLSNAIKYSGQSRRVEVAIACTEEHVRIGVRDYGLGVPEDEVPKLFARFFRASTAKGVQGTGIGLNLVKELVALHGGDVTVESTIGKGSLFTVSLPLAIRAAADNASAAA